MYILTIFTLIISTLSIGIPLHDGQRCMLIQGQNDPIKLQIKLPTIPNKISGQKFKVSLIQFISQQIQFDIVLQQKTIYRKNLDLPSTKLYNLCIEIQTNRRSFNPKTQQMYAQYTSHQNFDSLIGNFEIPEQLLGQNNLQYIYNMSVSIGKLNTKIIQNQKRQRQIEQQLAQSNLSKNKRISMFTIIQCVIIVFSGLYQVLSLRRFLIEKNLY